VIITNFCLQDCSPKPSETSADILDAIAHDLRSCLPVEGVLPSEIIRPPVSGKVECYSLALVCMKMCSVCICMLSLMCTL
jgi:hypothetical protein